MYDMKKQLTWSKLKVGIVITIALLLLFLTVFFAGGITNIFYPKVEIKAQLKDVKGLRHGSPVWLSGIEIGSVSDMKLHMAHGTVISMLIRSDTLQYIRKDSKAAVLTMGLLGDKYIELSPGSLDEEQIKPGDMIEGKTQLEIKELVNASAESFTKVTNFIDKIGNFFEKMEKNEGAIMKLMTDPELYINLKETTKTLSKVLKEFDDSQGTMKMLVKDPSLYNKMLSATSSMEELGRKMNENSGTLKKLIEDPSLYENLNNASKKLDAVLEKVNAGEGVAGTLVKDKELPAEVKNTLKELKSTIAEFKELLKDIKENPKKYLKFSVF